MCELFGASLSHPADIRGYLREFYSHSTYHPHGWGMLRYTNSQPEIFKEAVCANKSEIICDIIDTTLPQKNFLGHIRYATVGAKNVLNCHPFSAVDISGRQWIMIHNGTIYNGRKLVNYMYSQKGQTDSERVFMYLMDMINDAIMKSGKLSEENRFEIVEKLVSEVSLRNKFNIMIFDSDVLYVHKNVKNTLSIKNTKDGPIFTTKPFDNYGWASFPMCRLMAYKSGKMIFSGSKRTSEFIPALDYISVTAAMNI